MLDDDDEVRAGNSCVHLMWEGAGRQNCSVAR